MIGEIRITSITAGSPKIPSGFLLRPRLLTITLGNHSLNLAPGRLVN